MQKKTRAWKKKKEAREQVEKQFQEDEETDAIREGELKAAELSEAVYQAAREAKRLEEVSKKKTSAAREDEAAREKVKKRNAARVLELEQRLYVCWQRRLNVN